MAPESAPPQAALAAPDFERVRPWTLLLLLPVSIAAFVLVAILIPKGYRALRSLWAGYATLGISAVWCQIQLRRAHATVRDLVGRTPRHSEWGQILLALPAGVLAICLSWLTYAPLKRMGLDVDWGSWNPLSRFDELGPAGRVMLVLEIVVCAPIVEECLYRGLLLRAWSRRLGLGKAVIYTSLLFGVGHGNPLGAAVVGLVLAVLYVSSRTLLIPIGFHAFNNAIAVLAWRQRSWFRDVAWTDLEGWPYFVPLALLSTGALLLWFLGGARERIRRAMAQSEGFS